MNKKELLKWINKELRRIQIDPVGKNSEESVANDEWWRGRNTGWEEALMEIRRIYYK